MIPLSVVTRPGLAKPLNPKERAWAEELNRLLQACPSTRIGAYTIGDAGFTLYDKELERRPDIHQIVDSASDFGPGCHKAGIELAEVHSAFQIHSTAG